ncbi:MAG: porin family protein [Alphaproteobacteria bacterium]|nr:porin family protein [Alphaproteobacteria bacterium]MBN2675121.1 porin family protein [Alphaproteobacteria bacterium]
MKKIVLTSLMAVFAVTAASAAMTPYASLKLGYNSIQKADVEYQGTKLMETPEMAGYIGSIAGGIVYDVSPMTNMRGELEYTYSDNEEDATNPMTLSYSTIMVNGYADFGDATWVVKPYVGLGIGYSMGSTDDGDASGMAYGLSAGVGYAIDSNFTLDLGAKYIMHDMTSDDDSDVTFSLPTWSFMLGARYAF